MNRGKTLKLISGLAVLLMLSACGSKKIPETAPVEPEAERPAQSTEGSLWPGETSRSTLFSDKKASRVGDIIMVHLIEKTSASNKATTKTRRNFGVQMKNSTSGSASNFITPGLSGGRNFDGAGATTRSEKLTTAISAIVSEVLPNGQLRIDGQRRMKINDAFQYVQIKGLVRPEDINYDNSIVSSKIANAEIIYDGNGSLDKNQRTGGLLGKGFEMLWPF